MLTIVARGFLADDNYMGRHFSDTDTENQHWAEFDERGTGFFADTEKSLFPNVDNSTSVDKRVLDAAPMAQLPAFLMEGVSQYTRKIISTSDKVEFYITQSWINYTKTGESHHRHMHTNSLVSGVFHFSAVKELDKLFFHREATPQINVWNKDVNWYDPNSWFFGVGTGDLILFPSNVQHGVEKTAGRANPGESRF